MSQNLEINIFQIRKYSNGIVEPNANVIFNTIYQIIGNDISYNNTTGIIFISKPGYYNVTWTLSVKSAANLCNIHEFSLASSALQSPVAGLSNSPTPCEFHGGALITATDDVNPNNPVTLSLKNTSNHSISLLKSGSDFISELTITEIILPKNGEKGDAGAVGAQGIPGPSIPSYGYFYQKNSTSFAKDSLLAFGNSSNCKDISLENSTNIKIVNSGLYKIDFSISAGVSVGNASISLILNNNVVDGSTLSIPATLIQLSTRAFHETLILSIPANSTLSLKNTTIPVNLQPSSSLTVSLAQLTLIKLSEIPN